MSTYYRPTEPIKLRHIKENLDLQEIGFQVIDDAENDDHYFLYEGNYIHYDTNKEGLVVDAFRYGGNNADKVLSVLETEYEMTWVSEYEDEYDEMADEDTSVLTIHFSDLVKQVENQAIKDVKEGVKS
tara:strand:+ start:369 stop:752 length:384 start_codon:yes stop_codon:yes gene_type:complete